MKTSTTSASLAAFVFFLASVTLRAQSPPANDNFANRQVLPSDTHVSVAGTTDYATQEDFEKVYGAGQLAGYGINETNTVWYSYTPPVSGTVHLSATRDIMSESYTLVFQGSATPVAAAIVSQGYLPGDPSDGDITPPDFTVAAGQEYTISLGTTPPISTTDDNFVLTLVLTPGATPTPTRMPVASVTARGRADRATGVPGKFVVSLSAAASAAVTVAYKTSGSAVNGKDYKELPGTLTIPAGETSATVKVKPRAALEPSGLTGLTVAVKLKLQAGDGYTVGSANTAKVKIYDQN